MDQNVVFTSQQPKPDAKEADLSATAEAETGGESAETEESPPVEPPTEGGIKGFISSHKKILIGVMLLILLIAIVLFFIPRETAPQKVTLQWWGLWEDSSTMQGIISDFEKEYPHITIEYVKQNPQQYRERLETRIANGTGPDIFRYHNSWLTMMLESELLVPLSSEVISADEFQKNYYPVMQSDLVSEGALYGLPFGADTLALFVNTEIFDSAGAKVPTNWDDFVKVAKELTVRDSNTGAIKTSGAALGTYGNVTHASDIVALLFAQQGVTPANNDLQKQIDALSFYTSFATGETHLWNGTLDESVLAFSRGNLAMYFGYSWDIFTIRKLNEELPFTIHPVPGLLGKNTTIASYWVDGVSAQSEHKDEAFLFMHYLSQKATAEKLFADEARVRGFGEPYARVDLAPTLQDNELLYPFVSQLPNATSTYFSSNTHDGEGGLNSTLNGYLENAINAIVDDNTTVKSAVEDMSEGTSRVYSTYGLQ